MARLARAYKGFARGIDRCTKTSTSSIEALTHCWDRAYHRQHIHEKTVDVTKEIEEVQGTVSGPCRSTLEDAQSILTKFDALFLKMHDDLQALDQSALRTDSRTAKSLAHKLSANGDEVKVTC